MSNEEREHAIRWSNATTTSNVQQTRPGRIQRAYQRMLPEEQEQFERNLIESRKSAKEDMRGVYQYETSRIKGVTPGEAYNVAKLLEQMSPCEAIHHLYYKETPFRNAPVPNPMIGRPAWNAIRGKALNDLQPSRKARSRGLGLSRRQRTNILQENAEYTEEMRMIRYIASLYNLDPISCIEGYRSHYNRPNNLPRDAAFGRMEDFLGTRRVGGRRVRGRRGGGRRGGGTRKGGAKGNKNGKKNGNNTRRAKFHPLVAVKNTNLGKAYGYKGLSNNSRNTRGRGPIVQPGVYEGQESRVPIAINRRNLGNYKQKIREAHARGEITPQESHLVAKALEGRTPCDAIKHLYETRYQNLSLGAQNLVVGTQRLIQIIEAQFGVRASDCIAGYDEYVNNNNASSVNVAYYNEENNRNARENLSGLYVHAP